MKHILYMLFFKAMGQQLVWQMDKAANHRVGIPMGIHVSQQ